ncbi:MAG: hypothetical protein VKO21_02160 [Candidatus Sericytochromatia bacterium]|nr:hypothetical protein [Candidatus Sericytochromatia bacterium]
MRRERRARQLARWRKIAAGLILLGTAAGGWQLGRVLVVREYGSPMREGAIFVQPTPRLVPASLGR